MPTGLKNFNITLLHKASKDGWSIDSFVNNVKGKKHNLIIITAENGLRFGVYTPLPFTFSDSGSVTDEYLTSFIFSLDKKIKFSLKPEEKAKAIYGNNKYLLIVGFEEILLNNNPNSTNENWCNILRCYGTETYKYKESTNEAYEKLAGTRNFKTKEVEWYVINN